jgi:hypothetical protein
MWYSQRDLSTARIDEGVWSQGERYAGERRSELGKEWFHRLRTFAGYTTVKMTFETAKDYEYENMEYMSARDYWERLCRPVGDRKPETVWFHDYGKLWRGWSYRPSPEQMRDTRWGGEEDAD